MTKLTYTNKVLPLFSLSLLVATVGVFIGMQLMHYVFFSAMFIGIYIIEFVVLFITVLARRQGKVGAFLLFTFVLMTGITSSPIINSFVQTDASGLIFEALCITTIVFGLLSYYAYMSGENFSFLGGFLFVGLIGIILASLVNIFFRSPMVFLITDMISILLFSGFVLYDTSRILKTMSDDDIYTAVLALYLDFLNLFLSILEILGIFRRKD